MTISLIVAASENNVIGKNNTLPWHLPEDMKFFKDTTMGHCVIMGRKNFDSIPDRFRPLSGRTNIIVTRQKDFHADGIVIAYSIEEALKVAEKNNDQECFIIGGGEIFKQSMNLCDKIYLTRIHKYIEGDIFFPEIDMNEWKETLRRDMKADEKNPHDYSFIEYEKVK